MLLAVFAVCLPIVLGGAIPGQEKCAHGPPYWCSNVAHARECGATRQCLQTVWKFQIIHPESTSTCTYCELLVNEFRDALQDKATEEKVATVLTNVCAILPSTDTRNMCKDIVMEYTPEVIQMFENDISTDMICATLQLCSGLGGSASPYEVKATNSSDCDDCMKFFQDVQRSVTSNETLNQLKQLLNQTICSRLGSVGPLCMDFLDQYLPLFLQFLADQIDPDITCRVFGFCSTDAKIHVDVVQIKNLFQSRKTTGALQYRSSEECDICKDLMNQIVETLRDKTIQDKVTYELKNVVCVVLGSFADQCKELVDEYAPMLFELLVNELDPATFCETIGLCQVPNATVATMPKVDSPANMVGAGYVKDTTECTLCKLFLTEVDNLLKNNETINTIEEFIDKICVKLPTEDLATQCKAFVQEYGQLVIDLLIQELDPTKICDAIGLCNASSQTLTRLLKLGDSGTCQLCILLVQQIEMAVANMSAEELLSDMKAVCSVIPGTYADTCLKYVNEYGSIVISLLKTKEDPKNICQLVNMCQSRKLPYMTKPIPEGAVKVTAPSEECKICNTVVVFAKYFLQDNASKEEVKQVLESVCKLLPSSIESICEGFIANYGDNLIDLILRKLNATVICKELGLCQDAKKLMSSAILKQTFPVSAVSVVMSPYDTLPIIQPEEKKKESAPSIECEVCDTVILYLKMYLSDNASRAEIEQALKTLCTEVPSALTDTCKTLVDEYGDQIIELLLKKLDAHTVCTELGLCQAFNDKELKVSEVMSPYDTLPVVQQEKEQKVNTKAGGVVDCEACKIILNFLDKELQDNRTEENIKMLLEKFCSDLPDTFQLECKGLVDTYSQTLIDYLLLSLSPDEICKKLSFCPAMTKTLPEAVHVTLLKDDSGLKASVAAGPACVLCEFVMKEIDQILAGNKTEAAVTSALEKVCSFFPDTIRTECNGFVSLYSNLIVHLIVETLADPSTVCTAIRLCDSARAVKANATPGCVICEFVMKEVDVILSGNKSETAVVAALDKVCGFFPDTIRAECEGFVNTYGNVIIDLIVKSLADPSTVCTRVRLCKSVSKPVDSEKKIPKLDASPECVLCEFVLKEVDNVLGDNRTAAAIQKALNQVCGFFPDTIRAECIVFVDKYSAVIVQLIVNEVDPKEICTVLGMCSGQSVASWGTLVKLLPEKKKVGVDVCPICLFVVEQLQGFLKENKTTQEIEQFLKDLCDKLPDTVTVQCHDVIDEYIPAILDLIDENLRPDEICKQVGLCNTTNHVTEKKGDATLRFQSQKLVGQNKCTYGPAYWCASKDNAAECNAMEHCRRHVWN